MENMKIFWFDVETSGLDPKTNAILTLDYAVEIYGEIVEEGQILNRPDGKVVEDGALKINNLTREQIATFKAPAENYITLTDLFGKYVDKYDSDDKFYAGGYNVKFDMDFLRQFFQDAGDKYFGSWFYFSNIDPSSFFAFMRQNGMIPGFPAKQRLQDVAGYFGLIDEKTVLHNSTTDIRITRELYGRVSNVIRDHFAAARKG